MGGGGGGGGIMDGILIGIVTPRGRGGAQQMLRLGVRSKGCSSEMVCL